MIGDRPAVSPARALPRRAPGLPLLVLAVLCGLLAMHGLGATPPREGHPHRATTHSPAMSAAGDRAGDHAADDAGDHADDHAGDHGGGHAGGPQRHGHKSRHLLGSQHTQHPQPPQYADDCECGGADGHVSHADATCSASGTSGAPSMDGPAASTSPGPQPVGGLVGCWSRTGGERAPPSLHQLQLLRI